MVRFHVSCEGAMFPAFVWHLMDRCDIGPRLGIEDTAGRPCSPMAPYPLSFADIGREGLSEHRFAGVATWRVEVCVGVDLPGR